MLVDGNGDDLETRSGCDVTVPPEAGVLHRYSSYAVPPQDAREERECVAETCADDDQLRIGGHAARASEIRGERFSELRAASWVVVAEARGGQVAEAAAQCARPRGPGEGGQVGQAGIEVEARRAVGRFVRRDGARYGGGNVRVVRDPGAGAAPRAEISLGPELRVGLDDGRAREA